MIYLLVLILLLIPVIKYDWMAKTGGEKFWYYSCLAVLILLAGLRYRVGGDTLIYMSMFEDYPKLDELKYFDFAEAKYNPLWYILNAFSRSIYDSFTFFKIIHAVFVNSVFFWFFRKYCPSYYFSAIILYYIGYFCYFNMEVLRESLCISILLLSIPFYMRKQWLLYCLMCVISLLLHYSAVVMFFLPFLLFFKKPSWKWQITIFVIVLFVMRVVNIPVLLLDVLGFNEQLTILFNSYLENQRNIMGIIAEIIKYMPVFLFLFFRERIGQTDKYDFTPLIMGVVIFYTLSMSIGAFSRFINYFVPFIIVYAVNSIYKLFSLDFKRLQISCISLIFGFMLLCMNMVVYYFGDHSETLPNTRLYNIFYPYYSALNPKRDEHRERFIENYREVAIQF